MRLDKTGAHRSNFERNRRKIMATHNTCGICGQPVDMTLKTPHPMAPCIDHIIPIAKGGHPSDIANLQLAHWSCNRQKSDKLFKDSTKGNLPVGNRNLPQSMDWTDYKSK